MLTTASTAKAVPFRHNRLLHLLTAIFVATFVLSAIHPVMPEDWWLENGLVFVCAGLLIGLYRWLPFSQVSYILICLFLCLHEWGAHYRYAHVPVGEWIKAVFHTNRNDYDRVVHFTFGLLWAYPQREVLIRKAGLRNGWALCLPVALILGYGAAYEITEALAAWYLSPDAGDAFLGLQGDPWDTHKDMCMAFAGAAVAMTATAIASRWRGRRAVAAVARATKAASVRELTRIRS